MQKDASKGSVHAVEQAVAALMWSPQGHQVESGRRLGGAHTAERQGVGRTAMITELEALELARQVADVEGWRWKDPVAVQREVSSRSTRASRSYDLVVTTFISGRDCNICIRINGETGEVLDGAFHGGRMLPVNLKKWRTRPDAER